MKLPPGILESLRIENMNHVFSLDGTALSSSLPQKDALKDNAFNAVRFVCCLIVIVGHSLGLSGTPFAYSGLIDMHVSVCVFFILSGFWVTKSFLSVRSLKEYFLKRAKRLLPLYYITVVGFAVVCVLYSDLDTAAYFTDGGFWRYLFWNALFLNFMCPDLPGVFRGGAVNGALWTIKVEIGFYIVLPLLMYIIRRLNSRKKANLFLCGIYVCSVFWYFLLGKYYAVLGIPQQLSYQLPGYLSFFVMGMLFLLNWDALECRLNILVLPALVLFALHYLTGTELLLPLSLAVTVMWAGTRLKFLRRIGVPVDYTYGMYLFHFPLIQMLTVRQVRGSFTVFSIFLVVSASFFLAFLADKYIQKKIS